MARGKGEGTMYQRAGTGRWESKITLPDGTRRTFYGKTREEVRQKLHDAQEAVRKNLPIPYARRTVGEYLEYWLTNVAAQRVRPGTLKRYELDVRLHIKPALGKTKMVELTPQKVQKLIADLSATGLKPNTVRNCRAVLRTALAQAEKEGAIGRNVARLVTLPRDERPKLTPITPDDARRILEAFKGDEYEHLVTVALATGMREGELLGLSWDDVDFEAGTVTVRNQLQRIEKEYRLVPLKTEKSRRTLALPKVALDALRAQKVKQAERRLLLGPRWIDTGLVFTTALGNYVHASVITHHFRKKLLAAGLAPMPFHQLRHGAASLLLARGIS
ncbi:MAG TPA: site-specific integrase, partial [Dehalococcoidia bacterium]|nr:site-specific integrase [Dehalococcoidia bacterium]